MPICTKYRWSSEASILALIWYGAKVVLYGRDTATVARKFQNDNFCKVGTLMEKDIFNDNLKLHF